MTTSSDDFYTNEESLDIQIKPKRKTHSREESSAGKWGLGCLALFMIAPLTCCALIFACCGITFGLAAASESNEVTRSSTEILEVTDRDSVNLKVNNPVGETIIRGDDVSTIQVEVDMRANALTRASAEEKLDNIDVDIRRSGNDYIISVSIPDGGAFSDSNADLRITVPEELNLTATSNVGSLRVEDVDIRDELTLTSDIGQIVFNGALLNGDGDYKIQTEVGAIEVDIDSDSEFRLEASSDIGEINSDWDLQGENRSQEGIGQKLTGIYGDSEDPDATLTIITDIGHIQLND